MGIMLQNSLDADPNRDLKAIYVYEAPVRIWHWVMTLSIFVLIATGLLIAYPPPTVGGEASEHFLFGYIRFVHFTSGEVLAASWLLRVYWAFVGNQYSRQLFCLPLWSKPWWSEFANDIKTYAFLKAKPLRFGGHNPMAQFAMFFMLTLGSLFMLLTGFALLSEGLGIDSWAGRLFGWVLPLLGGSQAVHTWHHLCMWLIVMFTIVHLYMVIRQEITTKESILSTMIGGYRTFKD
jgi:Ni/Fe-hydrogenase 1 B-type cytochrome subunit